MSLITFRIFLDEQPDKDEPAVAVRGWLSHVILVQRGIQYEVDPIRESRWILCIPMPVNWLTIHAE